VQVKLGAETATDDGAFWMELDDFAINFHTVYTCRIFHNMPSLSVAVRLPWFLFVAVRRG
jgi:hypothetical protein